MALSGFAPPASELRGNLDTQNVTAGLVQQTPPSQLASGGAVVNNVLVWDGAKWAAAASAPPGGAAGGDLTGTFPSPTIKANVSLVTPIADLLRIQSPAGNPAINIYDTTAGLTNPVISIRNDGAGGRILFGLGGASATDATWGRLAAASLGSTDSDITARSGAASQVKIGAVGPSSEAAIVLGSTGSVGFYKATNSIIQGNSGMSLYLTDGEIRTSGTTSTSTLLKSVVDADAWDRFLIDVSGKIHWGTGAAVTDSSIARTGVDYLRGPSKWLVGSWTSDSPASVYDSGARLQVRFNDGELGVSMGRNFPSQITHDFAINVSGGSGAKGLTVQHLNIGMKGDHGGLSIGRIGPDGSDEVTGTFGAVVDNTECGYVVWRGHDGVDPNDWGRDVNGNVAALAQIRAYTVGDRIGYTTVVGVNALNSTTINVASTAAYAASGTATINGIAATYTGKTATTFTGCGAHAAYVGGESVVVGTPNSGGALVFESTPQNTTTMQPLARLQINPDGATMFALKTTAGNPADSDVLSKLSAANGMLILKTDGTLFARANGAWNPPTLGGKLFLGTANASLNADANNWDPFGTGTIDKPFIRAVPNAARNVTGMKAGTDGQAVWLFNDSATLAITLKYNSGSSSAGNKFICPGAADFVLRADAGVLLVYSTSAGNFWLVMAP